MRGQFGSPFSSDARQEACSCIESTMTYSTAEYTTHDCSTLLFNTWKISRLFNLHELYLTVTAFFKEKLFDVHPPLLVSHLSEDPQPIIKSIGPKRSFNTAAVKLLAFYLAYSIRHMFDRLFLPTARCTVPRVHVFAMSFRRGGGAAYALFVVAVIGIMLRSTTGPMMLRALFGLKLRIAICKRYRSEHPADGQFLVSDTS